MGMRLQDFFRASNQRWEDLVGFFSNRNTVDERIRLTLASDDEAQMAKERRSDVLADELMALEYRIGELEQRLLDFA